MDRLEDIAHEDVVFHHVDGHGLDVGIVERAWLQHSVAPLVHEQLGKGTTTGYAQHTTGATKQPANAKQRYSATVPSGQRQ